MSPVLWPRPLPASPRRRLGAGRALTPLLLTLAWLAACGSATGGSDGVVTDSGPADTGTRPVDGDGDGYAAGESGGPDCDDSDPAVNPEATETCNGRDDDCDGEIDEDASDSETWYLDADGDGFGDPAASVDGCEQPDGFVSDATDCDDDRADVHPGAAESWYDGVDADCLGDDDSDADGDGYGSAEHGDDDCDDGDPAVHPGADEVCDNGLDDDCDGTAGECRRSGVVDLDIGAKLLGEHEDDQAGTELAAAGDVDGDGADDLLVGADGEDSGGNNRGAVYLVLGPVSGTVSLADATAKIIGKEDTGVGSALAGGGDFDGDGLDDILLGCRDDDTSAHSAGAVFLFTSAISGTLGLADADAAWVGALTGDQVGRTVASAGDLDGDGVDDIIAGATGVDVHSEGDDAGAAYLLLGPATGTHSVEDAAATLLGEQEDDHTGWAVSAAGDTNGDGLGDVLVGAIHGGLSSQGVAYLVLGEASGTVDLSDADAALHGSQYNELAGYSVAGPGDVDGDGLDDILVGAPYRNAGSSDQAGAAYLVSGGVSGTFDLADADAQFLGCCLAQLVGRSVSGAGDFDADGHADIVFGAHGEDDGGIFAGAAYVAYGPVSGSMDAADADLQLLGPEEKVYAGWDVAGVGDVDADGRSDILVGARYDDEGAEDAGAAFLVFGRGM